MERSRGPADVSLRRRGASAAARVVAEAQRSGRQDARGMRRGETAGGRESSGRRGGGEGTNADGGGGCSRLVSELGQAQVRDIQE